ncbi:homoserine dehydrogenase, partial [bacterium]|nr:homoserine dehydrogenase [bacterium]
MKKTKIGIIGLGTVGSGVFKTLKNFSDIEILKISVKNINKSRNIEGLDKSLLTDNSEEIVNNPEIDIV